MSLDHLPRIWLANNFMMFKWGMLSLPDYRYLFWFLPCSDVELGITVGQIQYILKCKWWLHGDLMCTICYPSAMYISKSDQSSNIRVFVTLFYKTPLQYILFFVNPTGSKLMPTSLISNVYPSHLNKANCSALNSDACSIVWNVTAMPLNAYTTGDKHTTWKCKIILKFRLSEGARKAQSE
jgi:hypothetical protein